MRTSSCYSLYHTVAHDTHDNCIIPHHTNMLITSHRLIDNRDHDSYYFHIMRWIVQQQYPHHGRRSHQFVTITSHHIVYHHNAHARMNDIRPIPTLSTGTFPNCVPLSQNNTIKLDITQHDEARGKVIPEDNIRVGRWGR